MNMRSRAHFLLILAFLSAVAFTLASPKPATAGCTARPDRPECLTPAPTVRPTPVPTAPPTQPPPAPATARPSTPRPATPRPKRPTSTPVPGAVNSSTPDPALIADPNPTLDPLLGAEATPEVVVSVPVDTTPKPQEAKLAVKGSSNGGSASNWAFFFVGMVLGGLVGRASWGLKRRKKQQLFG